jgi:hypothetical protein
LFRIDLPLPPGLPAEEKFDPRGKRDEHAMARAETVPLALADPNTWSSALMGSARRWRASGAVAWHCPGLAIRCMLDVSGKGTVPTEAAFTLAMSQLHHRDRVAGALW